MKELISIQNLGAIKKVTIEEIKPLTVFIGESASGKSTIMKVIALFRWLYKMHNIRSYLKHSKISKTPFNFRMDTYFKNCGFEDFINKQTQIEYRVTINDNTYTLKYSNGKLSGTNDIIEIEDLYFNKLTFISETRNLIPLWIDKGSSLSDNNLGYYFQEVYNDFNIASESLAKHNLNYLNLNFSVIKGKSRKKYIITDDKETYEINLKNSSSGTQNAMPVSLIAEHFAKHFDFAKAFNRTLLDYVLKTDSLMDLKPVKNIGDINKKLFIHLEEPELSLFPDAQCKLIANLVETCFIKNNNDINLMFSTHSPYIINYLNLLIKAYDKNQLVDDAKFNYDNLMVYQVADGEISNLMAQNERVINTYALSETINDIYDRYEQLENG